MMRHPARVREEAIHLRKTQSLSLSELAEVLGVSRTTIRYWVKDIPTTPDVSQDRRIARAERMKAGQLAGTAAMQAKYAALRQEAYEQARESAAELLSDRQIRDFVVLYLAEGTRKARNQVSVANSNPHIVRFVHECFKRLSANPHIYYKFQYHADQDPDELKLFWGSYLGISPRQITAVKKTNSGHLKGRRFACEYGVFDIQVADTLFRSRLQALMDAVQQQWSGG
jgi:transcriptional regulator with XRE-family HTH domain